MDALIALWKEVGTGVLLLIMILSNLDKIGAALERVASRVLPSIAEERRLRLEAQREDLEHARNIRERERLDTVLALKEMLIEYRTNLDNANRERQRCQSELVTVITRYEKHDAAMIEALRDVSEILQEQSRILSRIAVRTGVYNGDEKSPVGKGE